MSSVYSRTVIFDDVVISYDPSEIKIVEKAHILALQIGFSLIHRINGFIDPMYRQSTTPTGNNSSVVNTSLMILYDNKEDSFKIIMPLSSGERIRVNINTHDKCTFSRIGKTIEELTPSDELIHVTLIYINLFCDALTIPINEDAKPITFATTKFIKHLCSDKEDIVHGRSFAKTLALPKIDI